MWTSQSHIVAAQRVQRKIATNDLWAKPIQDLTLSEARYLASIAHIYRKQARVASQSQIVPVTRKPGGSINTIHMADNYMKDTRDWPDPLEPRASKPPAPAGCTCHDGHKLDCPVHGLNGSQETLDNQWSNVQQANPVGYPQDAPRSYKPIASVRHVAYEPPDPDANDTGIPVLEHIDNTYITPDNTTPKIEKALKVLKDDASSPVKTRPEPVEVTQRTWQQAYANRSIVAVRKHPSQCFNIFKHNGAYVPVTRHQNFVQINQSLGNRQSFKNAEPRLRIAQPQLMQTLDNPIDSVQFFAKDVKKLNTAFNIFDSSRHSSIVPLVRHGNKHLPINANQRDQQHQYNPDRDPSQGPFQQGVSYQAKVAYALSRPIEAVQKHGVVPKTSQKAHRHKHSTSKTTSELKRALLGIVRKSTANT